VSDPAALRARLDGVRERIAAAARRAGRDRDTIRLVAISKTFPANAVRAVAQAGQIDYGENKVQEAAQKVPACADLSLIWHLVGHLQSNKVRKAAALFDVIHSIDSASLASRLDDAAREAGRTLDWLIQVDLAGEPTKHGARPDEVQAIVSAADACRSARLRGLMLLPPAVVDPDAARPYFRSLVRLRDELVSGGADPAMLSELSMGMSHDFEVAIEEGATMVRVGSAIFGQRYYP
jgi:pyridoxal phosphate enzyme (YggS family)